MTNQKPKSSKPEGYSSRDSEVGRDVSGVFISGDGNEVHVNTENSSSNKEPDQSKNIAIVAIVALIVIVIIVAAFMFLDGNNNFLTPSPTFMLATAIVLTETIAPTPVPTDTVPPALPTLTPAPATDTPVPTFTPVPPVALGEDWMAGCISTLWNAYPASSPPVERGNGCWQEPVYAFSAENGDLDFLAEREGGPAEIYALFAPLPEIGTVTFTVRLEYLDNADLWMGVFAKPDLDSQGLLMTILNGDVNRRSIVQKDPRTYETLQGTIALEQGNGFSISFTFTNLSVRSSVNPSVFMTNQVSIPAAQKWLFLGYKGLRGAYRIEGTFLNFELKP